jgi:hypothetical protein
MRRWYSGTTAVGKSSCPGPSPDKSSPKKVAAKLFILQGDREPLSSVTVWAEASQLLIGMWPGTIPF